MSSEVKIQLPNEIIQAHIKLAVANAIGTGDPKALIDAVVETALTKKRSSYGDKMVWEESVEKMILAVADECFKEFLDDHRVEMKKAFTAALTRSKSKIVQACIEGMLQNALSFRNVKVQFETRDYNEG